jgi:hypothetical protein
MRIVIDSFTTVPDLRLGEKSSARQTFQAFLNLEGLTGSVLGRPDLSIRMTVKVGDERNLRLIFFRAFRAFRGHCVTSDCKQTIERSLTMAANDGPLAKILAHAQNGDIGAQLALGKIYQFCKGVTVDPDQALKWFESAAAQDSADARCHLGVIHSIVQGGSLNYPKALKYYRLAASQGHAQAQYNLGVMYGAGHAIGKDKIAAYTLFKVSRQNGNIKQLKPVG